VDYEPERLYCLHKIILPRLDRERHFFGGCQRSRRSDVYDQCVVAVYNGPGAPTSGVVGRNRGVAWCGRLKGHNPSAQAIPNRAHDRQDR
jgi:hypothetical protein